MTSQITLANGVVVRGRSGGSEAFCPAGHQIGRYTSARRHGRRRGGAYATFAQNPIALRTHPWANWIRILCRGGRSLCPACRADSHRARPGSIAERTPSPTSRRTA